ncbi:hypothetical protein RintRC_6752 [Richelia intracellularis]|nr:hypothetical protein RintRC_6752 [Richelia intracellularis]
MRLHTHSKTHGKMVINKFYQVVYYACNTGNSVARAQVLSPQSELVIAC